MRERKRKKREGGGRKVKVREKGKRERVIEGGRGSPYAVEDEEELDEDTAKGEDASQEGGRYGVGEPVLVGNLSGNLVCVHWLLNWLQRENTTELMGECPIEQRT